MRVVRAGCGFPYNMGVKLRYLLFAIVVSMFSLCAVAQESSPPAPVEQLPTDKSSPPPKDNAKAPPRSDNVPAGESSSTQTQIDVSPPNNDAKSHPEAGLGGDSDVDEFTPYNPMKAMKDVEVGDWYYKQENYKAAISRYREALEYKPHDGDATFKLGQVLDKTGDYAGATDNYEQYLKMLPNGPHAKKAREGLDKLKKKQVASSQ